MRAKGTALLLTVARRLRRKLFPPRDVIEGYEQAELVETVFRKTKMHEPQGDWPLMSGVSTVLDFGGGCGLHYKLARRQTPDIRWAVVETPAMASRAAELATDRLRFFTDITDAATWLGQIDMMHSNAALHYTPDPLRTLGELCALKAKQMLWDRVLLSSSDDLERDVQSSFLGDNGPGSIALAKEKVVKYGRTMIPERDFLAAHQGFDLVDRGSDHFRFVLKSSN
jgi:putative methyltransferase (TIGR04325 family)